MLDEARRMVALLADAVQRSGRGHSDLERALGLRPGTLDELFGGRAELEVRHLLLLARELGLDPVAFFRTGVQGGGGGDAVLDEVERAFRDVRLGQEESPGPPPPPDLDLAGAKELVRETIREELARLARGEAAGERVGETGPAGPAPADD